MCSNWANWNYLSGVGTDPKEEKIINIESQSLRLDPNGDYIDLWHPKLGLKDKDNSTQFPLRNNRLSAEGIAE